MTTKRNIMRNEMKRMYRQGDVLIVEASQIPVKVEPVVEENGRVVLAHGEATGHHHSYGCNVNVKLFREDGGGSGLYMQATAPAALEHQEHDAIATPIGDYRVVRQREWDAAGYARRVAD